MTATTDHAFTGESYVKLSARDKLDLLWRHIEATEHNAFPDFTVWETLPLLDLLLPWNKAKAKSYLEVTVTRGDDVLPEGRKKVVHPHGSVVKVAFVPTGPNPYTGLFQGAAHGLARLSLAVKPGVIVLPGVACKFLVDGLPSANFLAMHSLTGQLSYNFFANQFTNVLPPVVSPLLKPFANFFALVSRTPTTVILDSLAEADERGVRPPVSHGPHEITLAADPTYRFSPWPHDFRADLATIPAETPIFSVFAEDGGSHHRIGTLVTKSRFIASAFGDDRLFFHHERLDGPSQAKPASA